MKLNNRRENILSEIYLLKYSDNETQLSKLFSWEILEFGPSSDTMCKQSENTGFVQELMVMKVESV